MFRHDRRRFGLLLPMALVATNILATAAYAQKSVKTNLTFAPVTLSLTADSSVISVCSGESDISSSRVELKAKANSPDGHLLRYRWSTTAGSINGDGSTVSWDLSGLPPGYYKAFVNAYTAKDEEECEAFSSTTVFVNRCPPVCPNISIVCQDNILVDNPITFSATVTGVSAGIAPAYHWTVSAGRIIAGQGTSSITVDTLGLAGQPVTAALSIAGYNLDCSASCGVQIPVPILPSRKFDVFPDIARNDEKARLDNFAVELQNDPTVTAYIIVYPSRAGRNGDGQRRAERIADYLINSRGIDARRIVTLVGSRRNGLLIELWLTPLGVRPPTPAP